MAALAHKWTPADFCNELRHVADLVHTRPSSQIGQAALVNLKQRLQSVEHWAPSDITAVFEGIAGLNLPQQLQEDIMAGLDNLTLSNPSNMALQAKQQSLHHLPPYLTNADWNLLEKASEVDMRQVIASRLKALGIQSMKEETKKACVAVMLHCLVNVQQKALPNPWAIYYMGFDLAMTLALLVKEGKEVVSGLKNYPASPTMLDPGFLSRAYGPSEGPSLKEVSLAAFYPKIACRKTSKLLVNVDQPKAKQSEQVQDHLSARLALFLDQQEADRDVQQIQENHQRGGSQRVPLQELNGRSQALPLTDKAVVPSAVAVPPLGNAALALPAPAVPPGPSNVNDQSTLEHFENEAYKVAKQKKETKSAAMKKPAASAKAGLKRATSANSAPAKKAKPAVLGCIRCRGNTRGCSTCKNPQFNGKRFAGRHEWVEWAQKNGKK